MSFDNLSLLLYLKNVAHLKVSQCYPVKKISQRNFSSGLLTSENLAHGCLE